MAATRQINLVIGPYSPCELLAELESATAAPSIAFAKAKAWYTLDGNRSRGSLVSMIHAHHGYYFVV